MFFSRTWLVGKVVDKIAASVGLTNANNRTHSGTVLCFFDGKTGQRCPGGETLESLLNSPGDGCKVVLHNGDTVILEYVEKTVDAIPVDNYF